MPEPAARPFCIGFYEQAAEADCECPFQRIDWHFGRIDNYLTAGYTEINRKTVQENGIRCKGIRTEAVRYLEWIIQEPHMTGDERQEEK